MKRTLLAVTLPCAFLALAVSLAPAQSGIEYRRSAILNGNQVRTVFGNWGVIGQPAELGHRGAWRNDNDGYVGDVSVMVGGEITWKGTKFHSVATCPVARPTALRDEDPNTGKPWTLEPVEGYFNANQEKVAVSTDRNSWPPTWPDKAKDPADPGWPGSWNGYFGKKISADQETYFVMDDQNDERFNFASNNTWNVSFKPDSLNPGRNGMALEVRVRAMQWAQFLAKDNMFWLYEITNTGTTTYNKTVFGMLVGTYVGVTSTEDYQEYNDDWSFYDPFTNTTYTGDFKQVNGPHPMKNPLWVGTCGLVGYAFLESPGNPFDGIDNDGDTDSSLIGVTAPKFTAADFDSVLLTPGKRIVLINDDFSRTVYTIPAVDSVLVYTRGLSRWIFPGKTKVVEGNIVSDVQGNLSANPNAYDGVDNNYNGLIDENYYIHFRQRKVTRTVPPVVLFDISRPLRHADYLTGAGTSPYSMIDEKRDDLIDNNQNWDVNYDDVGRDGIPNTHDFGEGDGIPTSGYDANFNDTGLPGEPHIDKTDVNESDQIGLTSFNYFTPANNFKMGDKEALWLQLLPGYFDVPNTIVNGRPQAGEDGDFIYGSGYFPLLAKTTERFSLALVYGGGGLGLDGDLADLLKNKRTVQKIYDANYQFPQPPDKPTLTAVPGDHKVTLYWDRKAEATVDPVLRTKSFEGYKLYKSTDPNFSDIFTITDASGSPQGYKPLAQYDLADGITGYFQAPPQLFQSASGYAIYLGNDTGLQHSYVDSSVDNGRRYFYALVAYSKGDPVAGIFPAENTKFVSILPSGAVQHDQNVAVVVPNPKVAGYVMPPTGVQLEHVQKFGTGLVGYNVVDASKLKPHPYQVEFFDTEVDSLDAAGNPVVSTDSSTWGRITTAYSVRDLAPTTESFYSLDTTFVSLSHRNLVPGTVTVTNQQGTVVAPANYLLSLPLGTLRGAHGGTLPPGTYTITYQYYPVYRSPNIFGSPYAAETRDADNFDGLQLSFRNYWRTDLNDTTSGWSGKKAFGFSFSPTNLFSGDLTGYRRPADYDIVFSTTVVDTAVENNDLPLAAPPAPLKFRIFNRTEGTQVKCYYYDISGYGQGSAAYDVQLVFLEKNSFGRYSPTWSTYFSPVDTAHLTVPLGTADTLRLRTVRPFRYGDLFKFTPALPEVNSQKAAADLLHVRVVPNPYVTAASFELPLNPGITSGRGERKIEFIHLPAGSTIKIFTARGDHVVTLHQQGSIDDGTVSWNLKTHENLDVAYGIYFYVVESSVGTTTGKIAIIK